MTLDEIQADNTAIKIIIEASDPIYQNETYKRVPKHIKRTGCKMVPKGKECRGNKKNKKIIWKEKE